jgi:hypothetical protein
MISLVHILQQSPMNPYSNSAIKHVINQVFPPKVFIIKDGAKLIT